MTCRICYCLGSHLIVYLIIFAVTWDGKNPIILLRQFYQVNGYIIYIYIYDLVSIVFSSFNLYI